VRLVRFGPAGRERPGVIDDNGRIRDVSCAIQDWSGDSLDPDAIRAFGTQLRLYDFPCCEEPVRLGACVAGTRNFIAVGLNYSDHAAETGLPLPAEPVLFTKAPSSIAGPSDDLPLPMGSSEVDWEVELALVIGRQAYRVAEESALAHVAGYCVCNDVSERRWQLGGTGQWLKGKSAPGFGPLGPWLVTPDSLPQVHDAALELRVNGVLMQRGSTSKMVFGPAFLVSYISRFMALEPGDVITTGTPSGVGMGRTPKRFLHVGDIVEASVEGLGLQQTRVVCNQSD